MKVDPRSQLSEFKKRGKCRVDQWVYRVDLSLIVLVSLDRSQRAGNGTLYFISLASRYVEKSLSKHAILPRTRSQSHPRSLQRISDSRNIVF